MKQSVFFALCVSLSMAISVAANAAAETEELIPEDTCIVELTLPEGATVTVDGKECGTRRRFVYESLIPRTTYKYEFVIHYPSGETTEHTLLLEGGRRVRLAKRDPKARAAELVPQYGHKSVVDSVAFSPDGRTVLTGSDWDTAILWSVKTGRKLRTYKGSTSSVTPAVFSPDGRTVLAGTWKGAATLWDTRTGRKLLHFEGPSTRYTSVAFGPARRRILTGSDETAILWNLRTGRKLRTFRGHSGKICSFAFSPDGRTIVTGSWDNTAMSWDVKTGRNLRTFEGHSQRITSVTFDPDGRTILTGSVDKTAVLWDAETGGKLRTLEGHTGWINSVAFSPDGRTVATGSEDETAILWHVKTGGRLRTLEECAGQVESVTFSPDSRTMLTGSSDGTAILWNVATGRKLRTFDGLSWRVRKSIAFSPNDRTILAGLVDKTAVLWDMKTGRKLRSFDGHSRRINSVAFSPDGRNILTGAADNTAILWDAEAGRKLRTFEGHTRWINSVAFSPDGRTVLTGAADKTAVLWDVETGRKLHVLKGHSCCVWSAAFSPDGHTVLTGSCDKTAILWNTRTGERLKTYEGHSGKIRSVAFSPDGRTALTGSWDKTAILWNVETGQKLHTFEGHSAGIEFVAFSPDGRTALTGSTDKTAILWDVDTGRKLRTLKEHSNSVWLAAFSPDGRTIVTCPSNNRIKLWSVATGELLLNMVAGENSREWLITTPEGLFDGSRGAINRICYRIGDGLNVLPVDQFFDGFYTPGLMDSLLRGERPLPQVDIEPPPAIQIVSPDSGGTIEQEQLTVEATIQDQGGGIQAPVVKLNGNRYIVKDAPVRENEKRLRWRFTIPLIPGVENTVEVHSATASGAIAGEPGRITVRCEKPKERPELYMVAVGISDYADGGPRDLDCAKNDAVGLAEVFQQRGEAFYGAGKVHVTTLTDKQATKKGIEKAIASVAKSAKPRDVFVLTLAGHGVTLGERYYFIPYDYDGRGEEWRDEKVRRQGLPEDELDDWIAAVPATKRILVYDTCQAGGALGRATSYEKTLESLARRSGCHVIAAASSNENAEELPDVGHGALTYALMAGLGAADKGLLKGRSAPDRDGLVHAVDWFRFAAENVPALTKLRLGKEQYVEFKSQAADFAILPVKTKDSKP